MPCYFIFHNKKSVFNLKTLVSTQTSFSSNICKFIFPSDYKLLEGGNWFYSFWGSQNMTVHCRCPTNIDREDGWMNYGKSQMAKESPLGRRIKVTCLFLHTGKYQFYKVSCKFQLRSKYILECLLLINCSIWTQDRFSMYFLKSARYSWAWFSRQVLLHPFVIQLPDIYLSNHINNSLNTKTHVQLSLWIYPQEL